MPRSPHRRPQVSEALIRELGPMLFRRDQYTCQACGGEIGDPDPYRPGHKIALTLGYVANLPRERVDTSRYIRTECENCNYGLRSIPFPKSSYIELITQIRRVPPEDQQIVLAWLTKKFAPTISEEQKDS